MLQEQDKQKLDGIVQQMLTNKESDENIRLVVDDFKQKYSKPIQAEQTPLEPQSTTGTLLNPLKEGIDGLKTLYGGGEQGIANKLKADIQAGAEDIQKGDVLKGVTKAGLRTAGDVAGAIYAPVGALLQATGVNKVFDYLGELSQKGGSYNPINLITDSKMVQDFVMKRPNLEEDFGRALNLAFAKAETGKIDPKTVVSRTIQQVESIAPKTKLVAGQVAQKAKSITGKLPEDIINKRVKELENISGNYAQLRKETNFNPERAKESVKRVAETDVLVSSVDENGLIRTKGEGGAVEQYKAQTLDNAENVVRRNLERLNESVTPDEIKIRLEDAIAKSGLEGAELKVALKKIDREIAGYKVKANPDGTIPLTLIQDAKVSKYKVTDFNTPAEIQAYNKAISNGLKETIEKNSTFNVKEVNAELAKYLQDIKFLEQLDGKRVKGGKLGKYFSQISGNIIGGTVGAAVGGPAGSAIGTIIGGELGGKIKGSMLQKTLGGETGNVALRNPIIQNAVDKIQGNNISNRINQSNKSGNLNQQYNRPKINIIRDIKPKSLEKPKLKNQNVSSSKDITKKSLLQRAIEKYKSIPNKQGGFVRIAGKEFKEVPEATKREMIQVIDYLNLKKPYNDKLEYSLSKLAEKYNINQDWSSNKIADTLEKLIENTKTK